MNRQQCCQLLPPSRRQTLRNGCLKVRQLWWTKKLEKSDIWQLFGRISHRDGFIKDFVACKACKKVYVFKASDGTQTLRKHSCDIGQSGPAAKRTQIEPKMPPFNWNTAGFTKSASPKF